MAWGVFEQFLEYREMDIFWILVRCMLLVWFGWGWGWDRSMSRGVVGGSWEAENGGSWEVWIV